MTQIGNVTAAPTRLMTQNLAPEGGCGPCSGQKGCCDTDLIKDIKKSDLEILLSSLGLSKSENNLNETPTAESGLDSPVPTLAKIKANELISLMKKLDIDTSPYEKIETRVRLRELKEKSEQLSKEDLIDIPKTNLSAKDKGMLESLEIDVQLNELAARDPESLTPEDFDFLKNGASPAQKTRAEALADESGDLELMDLTQEIPIKDTTGTLKKDTGVLKLDDAEQKFLKDPSKTVNSEKLRKELKNAESIIQNETTTKETKAPLTVKIETVDITQKTLAERPSNQPSTEAQHKPSETAEATPNQAQTSANVDVSQQQTSEITNTFITAMNTGHPPKLDSLLSLDINQLSAAINTLTLGNTDTQGAQVISELFIQNPTPQVATLFGKIPAQQAALLIGIALTKNVSQGITQLSQIIASLPNTQASGILSALLSTGPLGLSHASQILSQMPSLQATTTLVSLISSSTKGLSQVVQILSNLPVNKVTEYIAILGQSGSQGNGHASQVVSKLPPSLAAQLIGSLSSSGTKGISQSVQILSTITTAQATAIISALIGSGTQATALANSILSAMTITQSTNILVSLMKSGTQGLLQASQVLSSIPSNQASAILSAIISSNPQNISQIAQLLSAMPASQAASILTALLVHAENGSKQTIQLLTAMQPAQIAAILAKMDKALALMLLEQLSKEQQAQIVAALQKGGQSQEKELASLIAALYEESVSPDRKKQKRQNRQHFTNAKQDEDPKHGSTKSIDIWLDSLFGRGHKMHLRFQEALKSRERV